RSARSPGTSPITDSSPSTSDARWGSRDRRTRERRSLGANAGRAGVDESISLHSLLQASRWHDAACIRAHRTLARSWSHVVRFEPADRNRRVRRGFSGSVGLQSRLSRGVRDDAATTAGEQGVSAQLLLTMLLCGAVSVANAAELSSAFAEALVAESRSPEIAADEDVYARLLGAWDVQ